MIAFLKKHYIHIIGSIFILFICLVFVSILLSTLNSARSNNSSFQYNTTKLGFDQEMADTVTEAASFGRAASEVAPAALYELPYAPNTHEYTADLEVFETTDYYISGRTKVFDDFCTLLEQLKDNPDIHFKSLHTSLNNCNAVLFSTKDTTDSVLSELSGLPGVTTNRTTESVTRHKQQLESRGDIVSQQLTSVEQTLIEAEAAYDEIAVFARTQQDAQTYSDTINQKLQQIDRLIQRKISLTSQLDAIAQQSADLQERIEVDQITVNVSRSYALDPNRSTRAWEQAWEQLSDTWTTALIGITAYFAIFVLYAVQYSLYLVIVIVLARLFWKLIRRVWQW